MTQVQLDPVVDRVIGAAIEVHHLLGPGLLESTYKACLGYELAQRQILFEREVAVPVIYKGALLDCGYRLDLLVDRDVIVEVKSVEKILPIHAAQVMTYLRLFKGRRALLFNFNESTLRAGLRSYLGKGNYLPASDT